MASLPFVEQLSAAAGSTCPAQVVLQDVLVLSADGMHMRVPDLQGGLLLPGQGPEVPAGQTQLESWLSGTPLQSLSLVDVQSRGFAVIAPAQAVPAPPVPAPPVAAPPVARPPEAPAPPVLAPLPPEPLPPELLPPVAGA
ncbi:MAG: hypothetical protein ABI560_19645, partial [Myxococcales bacterium]